MAGQCKYNHMKAKCVHCQTEFSIAHSSESDLKQHDSTVLHEDTTLDLYSLLKVAEFLPS